MAIAKTKTNPYSVPPSPTHRVGLTEAEILDLLTLIQDTKCTVGVSALVRSANLKLNNVYEKANLGNKLPDYVPTGNRKQSAINLDSLGATSAEKDEFGISYKADKYRLAALPEDELTATFAQANHEIMTGIKLPLAEFLHGGNMFNKVPGVDLIPEHGSNQQVATSSQADFETNIILGIGSDESPTDNDSIYNAMKNRDRSK